MFHWLRPKNPRCELIVRWLPQMPRRSNRLSNYPGLDFGNLELVRDQMFKLFGATRFDLSSKNASINFLRLQELTLISACASAFSVDFDEATFVRQYFLIGGSGRFSAGRESGEISVNSPGPIVSAHTPLKLQYEECDQLVLHVANETLKRYLGVLIGQEVNREIVFENDTAVGPALNNLRRAVFHFASDYNARGRNLPDLVVAETERMLIMKVLITNWHNYTHLLLREPPKITLSGVRKVEEFIRANWDKPVDIAGMSALADVSARTLFRQFRKDRGYSPLEFAKKIRLDRAKELLEQGDESKSVSQIAYLCGFQSASHFARDFRLSFGELPSDVFKRSIR